MWEHQALTRARFSAGDEAIGRAFHEIRNEILRQPRNLAELKREVAAMRRKMYDAHAGKSELFDLKHDPGGLIDVEFIVQALVLGHAAVFPDLTVNRGNIALLRIAAAKGLIPSPLAETVRDAYREYRRMQHAERLNGAQYARVAHGPLKAYIEATLDLWNIAFGAVASSPAPAQS